MRKRSKSGLDSSEQVNECPAVRVKSAAKVMTQEVLVVIKHEEIKRNMGYQRFVHLLYNLHHSISLGSFASLPVTTSFLSKWLYV